MNSDKKITITSLISVLIALSLSGCSQEKTENTTAAYQADITVTEYGIPHITANDYASLGFGEGYMAAKDHVCNILYSIMMANGEVSKNIGSGENDSNIMRDAVVQALDIPHMSSVAFENLPIDVQDNYRGYAVGFNKYLKEQEIKSWCKTEDWLRPITAIDVFNRLQFITQTLPALSPALYMASPPSTEEKSAKISKQQQQLLLAAAKGIHLDEFGSNAWAIGKDLSENGSGMLLANPHYPWFGTNRFWEKQLTIPGKIDAYGVSLLGIPGVLIGFNKDIGWSHTVSKSQRIVLYKLTLAQGDPTSYMLDGKIEKMQSRDVSVEVRTDDGEIIQKTKKLYFSHHGPIVTLPGLGWDTKTAYAMRDANRDNVAVAAQWLDMSRAGSMDSLKAAHEKWNSMPWVNTIATSNDGQAVYIDNSNVGNLSDEALSLWQGQYENDGLTHMLYDQQGMTLLDGSDSRFDFVEDGSAPINGTVSYAKKPQITRSDYIFNANDSYWLSSPHQPMTGYSPLFGATDSMRTLRTRMNILHLEDKTARGEDGKFSLKEIQDTSFSDKSLAYDVYKEGLLKLCQSTKTVSLDDDQISIEKSCEVLSRYDGYLNIDSVGALVFREWLQAYNYLTKGDLDSRFAVPFSLDAPYLTPYGLGNEVMALKAMAMATQELEQSNWPIDSALGDVQHAYRGSTIIPLHGGFQAEGVTNMVHTNPNNTSGPIEKGQRYNQWSILTDKGHLVEYGSSFVMTLEYTKDGPRAEAFLTYGQSGNPENVHYRDQTQLFSEKKWRKIYFKADDVKKNAVETFTLQSE